MNTAAERRVNADWQAMITARIDYLAMKVKAMESTFHLMADTFKDLNVDLDRNFTEIESLKEDSKIQKEDIKELKAKLETRDLEELPEDKFLNLLKEANYTFDKLNNQERILLQLLCKKMADTDSCEQVQCDESSSDGAENNFNNTVVSLSSLTLEPSAQEKDEESGATISLNSQEPVILFIKVDPSVPTEAGSLENQSVIEPNKTVCDELENSEQETTPAQTVGQDTKSSSSNADGNDQNITCETQAPTGNSSVSPKNLSEGIDLAELKGTEDDEQKTFDAAVRFCANEYDVCRGMTYPLKLISRSERIGCGLIYDFGEAVNSESPKASTSTS